MARKDSEKDVERPRYYSQFWLDVAAGRKVLTGGKGTLEADEGDLSEQDDLPEVPMKGPAAAKSAPPPAAPAETPARWSAPAGQQPIHLSGKESLADLVAAAGLVDEEVPELTGDFSEEGEQEPETPLALAEEPEESFDYANLYDEEEEEEEEEGWTPRRGKKPKKPEKPRRREKGRDY